MAARRFALLACEFALLTVLTCATRCANWHDVFSEGAIYFTDADCYARMTRARICYEHPGTIVRHHEFENAPSGTTPHTTAPFDYAIVGLAALLRPFSSDALDLSGAFISPLLGLIGGWFLWWWMRRMQFRWRIVGLLLYAGSPILVHGTELGRPDHQSLALLLVLVAACAEWSLRIQPSRAWSVVAGAAWAFALWISAYEPLVLFGVAAACSVRLKFSQSRWIVFAAVVMIALLVEQRGFALPELWRNPHTANWLSTIGEMRRTPVFSATWLHWCGFFVIAAPILLGVSFRRRSAPPLVLVLLLVVSFAATLLQVRWSYFFAGVLALMLPALFAMIVNNVAAVALAVLSFIPIAYAWDAMLWPNEQVSAARAERLREMRDLHATAEAMISSETNVFIAPWWLSPALAYWSGNNSVAGSSHESIDGVVDTARFYLAVNPDEAREIAAKHHAQWVIAYDADRTTQNSAAILGGGVAPGALANILTHAPSRAPHFLKPAYQNGTCTLFSVQNSP